MELSNLYQVANQQVELRRAHMEVQAKIQSMDVDKLLAMVPMMDVDMHMIMMLESYLLLMKEKDFQLKVAVKLLKMALDRLLVRVMEATKLLELALVQLVRDKRQVMVNQHPVLTQVKT